jgi:hypothetical protein
MTAIYKSGVCTIVPHYNIGAAGDAVNVTHWGYTGSPLTAANLDAIQAAFNPAWYGPWSLMSSNGVFYNGCWVIDNSSATGGQKTNATYVPQPGLKSAPPVSDNVCTLISLHGFTRYRGGHSRLYIPGLSSDMALGDGRTVTATAITHMDDLWNNTVTAMNGITTIPLVPIIWHKKWAANPNSVENVASHTSQTILASQRRRLRKVARHRSRALP